MRRILALGFGCALLTPSACGDTAGGSTSDSGGSTSAGPTTEATTTASSATTTASSATTTDGSATGSGSTSDATNPTTTAGSGSSGGGDQGVMGMFGHPCTDDADCMAILGADGVCLHDILMVYNLPGGYCSRLCHLPDAMTAYVKDDPICGQGVYCIGAMGYFEGCVVECQDNSDCPRMGYECRIMPTIGMPGDPKFCLMTDDNMI